MDPISRFRLTLIYSSSWPIDQIRKTAKLFCIHFLLFHLNPAPLMTKNHTVSIDQKPLCKPTFSKYIHKALHDGKYPELPILSLYWKWYAFDSSVDRLEYEWNALWQPALQPCCPWVDSTAICTCLSNAFSLLHMSGLERFNTDKALSPGPLQIFPHPWQHPKQLYLQNPYN